MSPDESEAVTRLRRCAENLLDAVQNFTSETPQRQVLQSPALPGPNPESSSHAQAAAAFSTTPRAPPSLGRLQQLFQFLNFGPSVADRDQQATQGSRSTA